MFVVTELYSGRMSPAEVAAYVGAAAWLPQVAGWIYRRYVEPVLSVMPDAYAEVGFTSFGPIFNMRMALSAEHKDLIIDDFALELVHSDGDSHTMRWAGLQETFSQITDLAGNRQTVSRDQTPIAVKVGTESLIDKFVRFQQPDYFETDRPLFLDLVAHFNFLKVSESEPSRYVERALASKELFAVVEGRKKAFWWKPGRYRVSLKVSSPKPFKLARSQFEFNLTSLDIDRLVKNLETLKIEIDDTISSNLPKFQARPINWNWANVNVR